MLESKLIPKRKKAPGKESRRQEALRIGFVPTIDGATVIAAQELGLYQKHGVTVTLVREIGWASIREKLVHGEIEAAQAPASMAFTIHCGIGSVKRPCVTGIVLNLNGSAITLSTELLGMGVSDPASLKRLIDSERGKRVISLAAVLEYSTQKYLLCSWLRSGGIDPEKDVSIPILPSPLVHQALAGRHIDGYCVAEPWNSLAVQQGIGGIVGTSAELTPRQPEKVLLMLEKTANEHRREHLGMIAAIIEASIFCENPANRPELARMLANRRYFDLPVSAIAPALVGPLETGAGRKDISEFITYHRMGANRPDRAKGREIFNEIRKTGKASNCRALRPDIIARIFREDLYDEASRTAGLHAQASSGSPIAGEAPGSSSVIATRVAPQKLALAS